LKNYQERLIELGAPNVHLAGSGPSLFVVLQNETEAGEIYTRCKNSGMKVHMTGTRFKL
jgi:homoserine kinase